jgi:hypothetical protein
MVKSVVKKGGRRSSQNDVNHNASAEIGRCIVVSPTPFEVIGSVEI